MCENPNCKCGGKCGDKSKRRLQGKLPPNPELVCEECKYPFGPGDPVEIYQGRILCYRCAKKLEFNDELDQLLGCMRRETATI